ncbi:phospholipase D-like domain-containing protein [Streptomyces sp. NPDC050738]|uniref:phospholipase D-like domain-containing protein n=1 Tax=Streptomyces sp. NPDC050738 TaxID=3154744 RepID=UPI0034246B01
MARIRPRLRGILPAAFIALGLTAGGLAPAAPAAAAVIPVGPIFNKPTGTTAEQQTIRNQARTLIQNADSGAIIRLAIYHFWDDTIATELANAKGRGVSVRVVMDESTISSTSAQPDDSTYNILKSALGTDTAQGSFVKLCTKSSSCLGPAGTGINHNKFLTVTSAGGGTAKDVVMQLTSNLSPSNYSKYWNSSLTVAGNSTLYDSYIAYFAKLPAQNRSAWTYTTEPAGDYKTYFFPRAGTDSSTDTVVNMLDNVQCTWSDTAGAHRTTVHAAMLKISRQAVADKLRSLAQAGCLVDVVYSDSDPAAWSAFHGVTNLQARCYQDGRVTPTSRLIVHSKNLMINGMYDGSVQQLAWTGSHNWSGPALRNNDESMLKISNTSVVSAFEANFSAVRAAAYPGTNDNTDLCKADDTD